jgi:hypothetical protein
MRRTPSFLVESPAIAVAAVALLAATGGWAIAATSKSSPVIRACANKRKGTLRLASRCRRGERSVTWGKEGPAGTRGETGAPGIKGETGPKGEPGPPGPGATYFSTTVSQTGEIGTLATLDNGLTLTGQCNVGLVGIHLLASGSGQVSGTAYINGELVRSDSPNFTATGSADKESTDVDVIARGTPTASFTRIDVHGQAGSPCTFWGMITPSS